MGNRLLDALHEADWHRWQPQLEPVDMLRGQTLYDSGCHSRHLFFPTSAIVSLTTLMESGSCAEVATVGNDGVVGIAWLMGGASTTGRAVVQSAGLGFRLDGQVVRDELACGGPVMHLLLRYTQSLFTQVAQTATCNRHHSVEQQVSRLLLAQHDRVSGDVLRMTHELLASRLGVRRESVTSVAARLQRAGLISYARGRIEVLDRPGLSKRACECYAAVRTECDRLLPPASADDAAQHHEGLATARRAAPFTTQ